MIGYLSIEVKDYWVTVNKSKPVSWGASLAAAVSKLLKNRDESDSGYTTA